MSEKKDPFKFDDFFDTIEPKNEMATKEEIEELLIFIGGFEKWPVLNEDCRREVVKYLDYESRFNLGICSKNDHETVEKTKIRVESIEIFDNQRFHFLVNMTLFNNVTVRIYFPTGNPIEWIFSQVEEDTRVRWFHEIPKRILVVREVIWKSCDVYEAAVKFAEKWMKKSNFELTRDWFIQKRNPTFCTNQSLVNAIKVEMNEYPFESSQIKTLPCCKDVRICADDVDTFDWWLKKCPEQLDWLQLGVYSIERNSFTLPSEFLNAPQIMQASAIRIWCRAALSDEQLLKLKAKSMHFDFVEVTDEGINKFIRNWVFGKAVNGFTDLHLWASTVRNPDVIVAGLDKVKEWDEAFENEQRGFVEEFKEYRRSGRYYQIKSKIDPFESLTLNIDHECVSICATGKRLENNGEASTFYRIP